MNKIVTKFLLVGSKSMSRLHFRHPGFTYSFCGPFTKCCERIQKFRQTGKNELDKAYFAHDAVYSDSKDLAKRIVSEKILKDRAYEITKNHTNDGYQRGLASMINTFFDKKAVSGVSVNEELPQELRKPVIKKFKRRKVYARFEDKFWQQIYLKWDHYLLKIIVLNIYCVINVFTKHASVKTLKDKKGKTVRHGFVEIVNKSNHKPNNL